LVPDSYPFAISWGDEEFTVMRERLERYAVAYKAFVLAERRARRLARAKMQSIAADLWNEA
jgi:hypothetical protein